MKTKKLLLISVLAILFSANTNAQELLLGLQENPAAKKASEKRSGQIQLQSGRTCELPFIDDFSRNTGFIPDQTKWQSTSVYINNSYGMNAPSVGVATFDAINSKGVLYNVGHVYSEPADTLLSHNINLVYPLDSIYLTFYFQAGGYGDMPEARDSLILQFYNGSDWKTVWSAYPVITDSTMVENYYRREGKSVRTTRVDSLPKHFFKAHVKVDRAEFLISNFQMRFINHASVAINNFVPGRASNADHWNLDYVYLDKGRNSRDTVIKDVAITMPQQPLSTMYEEIPWSHYNSDARAKMFGSNLKISLTYNNLGWGTRNVARHFEITPMFGNGEYLSMSGGAENIDDFETFDRTYQLPDYDFYSDTDSAQFEVKSYLITDSDPDRQDYRYNDTTTYYHRFYNCYAYDDGTAENGYGLFGAGSSVGEVGIQFYCFASDSLRGVYMYFNRTINNANEGNAFKLTIWSDDNGIPGEVLYTQGATKPTYSDSLNQFVAYKFTKPIFIGRKTNFYIGWQQTNDDFINVGYDRNRNHADKVFYNIGNGWEPSIYTGSPMIRPIFSTEAEFPDDPILPPTPPASGSTGIILSPNPATDFMRMSWTTNTTETYTIKRVEFYDLRGRLVKVDNSGNDIVSVADLQAGTYIVRISDGKTIKETKKIIVAK